jgi:uncharacterized membrane protein YtjA (UPF0391 family)
MGAFGATAGARAGIVKLLGMMPNTIFLSFIFLS